MNILEIVRKQISHLPEGPHMVGLKSILRHIEAAHNHLSRGQDQNDESAFSDVIYRTNQAFEGSIKEAYRIIAGKDPKNATPYSIEQYLQKNNSIRQRVLSQLTNYRTEWRNPSTHDYNLDFDEDEAFLAIVSVSAFAKLLLDQITEKLVFEDVSNDLKDNFNIVIDKNVPEKAINIYIGEIIMSFISRYVTERLAMRIEREAQLIAGLSAFIGSAAPEVSIIVEPKLRIGSRTVYGDIIVESGSERVIIEVKSRSNTNTVVQGLQQLSIYMDALELKFGVLFAFDGTHVEYLMSEHMFGGGMIVVVAPRAIDVAHLISSSDD